MVRLEGLEPPRLAPPEPKSGVSTNSTTPANTVPMIIAGGMAIRSDRQRQPLTSRAVAANPFKHREKRP